MRAETFRVCYFGTYRANYSRNQIMIEGLRSNGVEVIECHEQLWYGIEDRIQAASGGWMRPAFLWRLLKVYTKLLLKYRRIKDYDVMVVGYPGQLDVFLARLLSWVRRKPLVWDVFMSIYLIALERELDKRSRLTVFLIRWLERLACQLPDMLIIDTPEYATWFQTTYGVSINRFRLVPTGADDRIFKPVAKEALNSDGKFRVVYYGTFIPNHGVEYIIEAARLLANDHNIHFELIGEGPEKEKAVALARRYNLRNVEFVGWLDKEELAKRVSSADICLGVFGTTPQSLMTIQNKIYEALAMSKPVITGDSLAVRKILQHQKHVFLCERANPEALAQAILTLYNNPILRRRIASSGYELFCKQFTSKILGGIYRGYLENIIKRRGANAH